MGTSYKYYRLSREVFLLGTLLQTGIHRRLTMGSDKAIVKPRAHGLVGRVERWGPSNHISGVVTASCHTSVGSSMY